MWGEGFKMEMLKQNDIVEFWKFSQKMVGCLIK